MFPRGIDRKKVGELNAVVVPIQRYEDLLAQLADMRNAEAAERAENALLRQQIADLIAQVAKLTDRVTELAAAAARNKRGASAPKPAGPAPAPPNLSEDQKKAFEARPKPPEPEPRSEPAPKPRKPVGRNPLPGHLPVDESTSKPCACASCGSDRLDVVDEFDEEKLTVVKEHQRRRLVHRVTARCRSCGERTTGEAPPAPYERSKITCEWLAWFIVQKFAMLTPLDRILRHLRLQGIRLSMGTAVRFVGYAADLLGAVDGEHWRQLKASGLMQSDGTHFAVVIKGVPGTHRGYIEVYLNGSTVVFQYEPEKGGDTLKSKLRGCKGFLVVDAEHRFNGVFEEGTLIEVGCNARGRRRFEAAEKTQPLLAAEGGRFLAAAFAAEDEARAAGLAGDALRAWRQERVRPLYAAMRAWMDSVEPGLLPDDALAETIRYYRNHWAALTRWVDHPELPPDNSRSEREFQQIAKARHSWLHAGGTEGAHRAATLLGVVATARNVGVDVEKYLCWAFERRGTWRHRYDLTAADLTPAARGWVDEPIGWRAGAWATPTGSRFAAHPGMVDRSLSNRHSSDKVGRKDSIWFRRGDTGALRCHQPRRQSTIEKRALRRAQQTPSIAEIRQQSRDVLCGERRDRSHLAVREVYALV